MEGLHTVTRGEQKHARLLARFVDPKTPGPLLAKETIRYAIEYNGLYYRVLSMRDKTSYRYSSLAEDKKATAFSSAELSLERTKERLAALLGNPAQWPWVLRDYWHMAPAAAIRNTVVAMLMLETPDLLIQWLGADVYRAAARLDMALVIVGPTGPEWLLDWLKDKRENCRKELSPK